MQCLLRKALEYVFKDIQGKSQLFPGNRKGRIEIDHISQRPQQKPLGKRFLIKFIAHAAGRIIRRLLLFIRHQFQGMDQSDMPDFPDMGMFPYALGKLLRKPGGKGLGLFEDTMVHKFIQDAMSRRAAQRISCIRVAVDKSLVLAVIRIKAL